MPSITFRAPPFRLVALIVLVLASLGAFVGPASAGRVILSGSHSQDEILRACVAAGGTFSSGGGGYACTADGGSVTCNKSGKCYGECPSCGTPAVKHGGRTPVAVLSGSTLKTLAPTRPRTPPTSTTGATAMPTHDERHPRK